MKKLFAIATLIAGTLVMVSCGDDDGGSTPAGPSVTNPDPAAVTVGTDVTINFDYTAPGGFSASGVTATGGTASVTTDGVDGATSGTITVTFTAGTSATAGSVTLTVTDANNLSNNGVGVVAVSASAVPAIANIPTSATVVTGGTLAVPGVELTAADGFATFTATVNGGTPIDLASLITVGGTSATIDLSFTTADLSAIEGNNTIIFVLTDADGDAANFTHTLTVEALAYDVVDIADLDYDGDGDPTTNPHPAKEITGSINADFTFDNTQTWILAGRVKVVNGATLTIEAGSVIKGRTGTGGNATALLVASGASIEAVGTATAPIIMTAIADDLNVTDVAAGDFVGSLAATVNGEWGGLIVLGDAPISASADQVQIEGIPTSDADGLYGGTNETHDAGTIRYVSVRHGGSLIGAGNEINGITFGGVGSGTEVAWVEVVGNQDDGIEWFGGSVDVSNALVWNAGDDGLDTDQDWQGTCDGFLVVTPFGQKLPKLSKSMIPP